MTSMQNRLLNHRITKALVALLLIACLGLVIVGCVSPQRPTPMVDVLASNFRENRQHFLTISQLASVDATFGIDVASGSLGSDSIASRDVPGYSDILVALQAIGAEHVSASDHAVDVSTASEGLAVSGRESGYYYTADSTVTTVTLDVARSPKAPRMWLYPLGDGWYVSEYRF